MITDVIKGVDDDIEFKGFKGRYFYKLAGMVIGLLVFTFLSYSIGLNSLWFFVIVLLIGIAGFLYIQNEMQKLGKYGHLHKKHSPPKAIVQSMQFYKFLKK